MSIGKKNLDSLNEDERNKMDASHGRDEIEIENNEAKRINDMDTFAPMDGEIGYESTDYDDLPSDTKKNHNYYDPTLSTGGKEVDEEKTQGFHVSEAGAAGIAFGKDNYVDEDDDSKTSKKKNNKN